MLTMTTIISSFSGSAQSNPQLGKNSIDEVIKAMSLEEKVHLLMGTGMDNSPADKQVLAVYDKPVPGASGNTYAIERLGIPAIVLADGPAGVHLDSIRPNDNNTYFATHFPIGTALASTWNTELVENVTKAMGNEALEYGVDILLAPALNIHRNPLGGRNFEYYSEDPVVSGKIAEAYAKGVQSNSVGTSIKHFVANNQESGRLGNDARVSQRALREIYLKGFEIAIKGSKPWTVMTSYNRLNGVYTSENAELIETLLRNEWGFGGLVMSDWYAGEDVVAQMNAGNDMLQPGSDKQYNAIVEAVQSGKLDEAIIDRNVKNILNLILQTPRFKNYKYSNKPDLKAHAEVARQAGSEAMVLLKNNQNTLPLSVGIKNIALLGSASYSLNAGGGGSGDVNTFHTVSLVEALSNAGYQLSEELQKQYDAHLADLDVEFQESLKESVMPIFMAKPSPTEINISTEQIKALAEEKDVAILTIGRKSGESVDRTTADFELSKDEQNLLDDVCTAFHAKGKKVIVILNIGGAIETASWKNKPDAILLSWQTGQETGNSIVDILSGKISPSGKLAMTFAVALRDDPSSANFPMGEHTIADPTVKHEGLGKNWDYTNYEEDIYVGYHYYDAFKKEISYPFGYGLSYTTFEYSNPKIQENSNSYTITIQVKNSGNYAGKEVVELYVSAPKNNLYSKPEKELKAFAKTNLLKPGEKETITLTVSKSELASFNEKESAWQTDAGTYQFLIGASSRDIKATDEVQIGKTTLSKVNDILKPASPINTIKK